MERLKPAVLVSPREGPLSESQFSVALFAETLVNAIRMGLNVTQRELAGGRICRATVRGHLYKSLKGRPCTAGVKDAVLGAYYFARSVSLLGLLEDEKPREPAFIKAAESQGLVSQAFLALPFFQRETLFSVSTQQLGIPQRAWQNHCSGAMAVARMVYALTQCEAFAQYPDPYQDAIYGIDLFCGRRGSLTTKQLEFALQLKVSSSPRTTFRVLDKTQTLTVEQKRIRGLVREHNELSGQTHIPVWVEVGRGDLLISLEECSQIQKDTNRFLVSLGS
jgi:hypothetical protein